MKPVYWDSGFRWDDPNIRWGDPSYQLEPGDPGYVNPSSSGNQTTKRKSKMKRNSYWPSRQGDQVTWLTNFMNEIGDVSTTLGLTSDQVTAAKADCAWLIYVIGTWLAAVRPWSLACTDAVTEAETGSGSSAQELPVFNAPALPTGVTAVNPGALNRIFALVQQIKESGKCTETIASELGIIGAEDTGPDFTTLTPVISASIVSGQALIKWSWGGFGKWLHACEIQVDRNDGKGFVLLTIDTTPNYTDTQPFPTALTKWTYKAIYRTDDAQAGNWCAPVSITVGG